MTNLATRIQMLDVGSILQFFKLELPNTNEKLLFHCNGVESDIDDVTQMETQNPIMVWQGENYSFVGIKTEGMRLSGDGSVNSPTLEVSNNVDGVQGAVSALCRMYRNLQNAKLTIYTTTLEAYQLGLNQYKQQFWWISQKTLDTSRSVTFALDMPANHNKKQIPTRIIDDICAWAKRGEYRGEDCGYTGTNYFDAEGNPVESIALDDCGGLCEDCQKRFGTGVPLPFGGALVSYMRK